MAGEQAGAFGMKTVALGTAGYELTQEGWRPP
jgi:hypothetical protein